MEQLNSVSVVHDVISAILEELEVAFPQFHYEVFTNYIQIYYDDTIPYNKRKPPGEHSIYICLKKGSATIGIRSSMLNVNEIILDLNDPKLFENIIAEIGKLTYTLI